MFNSTTVEHLSVARMQERERAILDRMFGMFQFRCDYSYLFFLYALILTFNHDSSQKFAQRKKWDEEWGRIGMEGNIWWLGSRRLNWEARMGPGVWYWLRTSISLSTELILTAGEPPQYTVPIGRSQGDGLDYPVNPRFDPEGRWRPRAEWPPELQ